MDFIDGLPKYEERNAIMVVVDRLMKYAHFGEIFHPYTAAQVALQYLDNVYKLPGFPLSIVSD